MDREGLSELLRLLSSERRRELLRRLRGRSMSASELAAEAGIPLTNMARDHLEPLTRLGLIESHPDPDDLRRRVYRLTSLGARVEEVLGALEDMVAGEGPGTGPPESPPAQAVRAPLPRPPLPYLLLYNSGYLLAWAPFLLSIRGLLVGILPPWVPLAWLLLSSLASVAWHRVERGWLRRRLSPSSRA